MLSRFVSNAHIYQPLPFSPNPPFLILSPSSFFHILSDNDDALPPLLFSRNKLVYSLSCPCVFHFSGSCTETAIKRTFLVSPSFYSLFFFFFSRCFFVSQPARSSPFHLQGDKPQFPETFSFYWQERRKRNKAYRLMCGILLCIRLCAKCCTVQISYGRKKNK